MKRGFDTPGPSAREFSEQKPTKEEWEAYKKEIETLWDEIMDKAHKIFRGANRHYWIAAKRDALYNKKFFAAFPNHQNYIAWHKIISSGVDYEQAPRLDFPDPYNVKKFCLKLLEELEDEESCLRYVRRKNKQIKIF